jgi:hypothetical protein
VLLELELLDDEELELLELDELLDDDELEEELLVLDVPPSPAQLGARKLPS